MPISSDLKGTSGGTTTTIRWHTQKKINSKDGMNALLLPDEEECVQK